jgi:hypothetical protein
LAVFEADEAKLLVELRNYSQHKFLPYLNPAWQFSQTMPMAEFQFRLHVAPLLKWDSLTADVRKYRGCGTCCATTILAPLCKCAVQKFGWDER